MSSHRHSTHSFLLRFLCLVLAGTFFFNSVVFAHKPEISFWEERQHRSEKSADKLASLPTNIVSTNWLNQFPSAVASHLASEPFAKRKFQNTDLATIFRSLPNAYGTIRRVSSPKNSDGRTVIHIQDVHLNAEAQRNISSTIRALIDAQRIDAIALEGGAELIDVSNYRNFPHQDTIQKVARFLLRENKITGPIFAAITSKSAIPALVGIDDETHYQANIAAYREATAQKDFVKKQLSDQSTNLTVQRQIFNPDLKQFDAQVSAYNKGKVTMGQYVRTLSQHSLQLPQDVELFLEALNLESSLNFKQVEEERTVLLAKLSAKITKEKMDQLISASAAFKAGQLNHADFYQYLRNLCEQERIVLSQFKAMNAYIQYVLLSEQIDGETLLTEVKQLERQAYAALVHTAVEQKLVSESNLLALREKLVDFSLSSEEWREYRRLVREVRNKSEKSEIDLSSFERFYEEAGIRDQAMANNLLQIVRQSDRATVRNSTFGLSDRRTVVLVTGGFHSNGIDQRLQEAGITSITFVPKISKVETATGAEYLSVFTQEKTPLEKMFEGNKLFLNIRPFAPAGDALGATAATGLEFLKGRIPDGNGTSIFNGIAHQRADEVQVTKQAKDARVSVSINSQEETMIVHEINELDLDVQEAGAANSSRLSRVWQSLRSFFTDLINRLKRIQSWNVEIEWLNWTTPDGQVIKIIPTGITRIEMSSGATGEKEDASKTPKPRADFRSSLRLRWMIQSFVTKDNQKNFQKNIDSFYQQTKDAEFRRTFGLDALDETSDQLSIAWSLFRKNQQRWGLPDPKSVMDLSGQLAILNSVTEVCIGLSHVVTDAKNYGPYLNSLSEEGRQRSIERIQLAYLLLVILKSITPATIEEKKAVVNLVGVQLPLLQNIEATSSTIQKARIEESKERRQSNAEPQSTDKLVNKEKEIENLTPRPFQLMSDNAGRVMLKSPRASLWVISGLPAKSRVTIAQINGKYTNFIEVWQEKNDRSVLLKRYRIINGSLKEIALDSTLLSDFVFNWLNGSDKKIPLENILNYLQSFEKAKKNKRLLRDQILNEKFIVMHPNFSIENWENENRASSPSAMADKPVILPDVRNIESKYEDVVISFQQLFGLINLFNNDVHEHSERMALVAEHLFFDLTEPQHRFVADGLAGLWFLALKDEKAKNEIYQQLILNQENRNGIRIRFSKRKALNGAQGARWSVAALVALVEKTVPFPVSAIAQHAADDFKVKLMGRQTAVNAKMDKIDVDGKPLLMFDTHYVDNALKIAQSLEKGEKTVGLPLRNEFSTFQGMNIGERLFHEAVHLSPTYVNSLPAEQTEESRAMESENIIYHAGQAALGITVDPKYQQTLSTTRYYYRRLNRKSRSVADAVRANSRFAAHRDTISGPDGKQSRRDWVDRTYTVLQADGAQLMKDQDESNQMDLFKSAHGVHDHSYSEIRDGLVVVSPLLMIALDLSKFFQPNRTRVKSIRYEETSAIYAEKKTATEIERDLPVLLHNLEIVLNYLKRSSGGTDSGEIESLRQFLSENNFARVKNLLQLASDKIFVRRDWLQDDYDLGLMLQHERMHQLIERALTEDKNVLYLAYRYLLADDKVMAYFTHPASPYAVYFTMDRLNLWQSMKREKTYSSNSLSILENMTEFWAHIYAPSHLFIRTQAPQIDKRQSAEIARHYVQLKKRLTDLDHTNTTIAGALRIIERLAKVADEEREADLREIKNHMLTPKTNRVNLLIWLLISVLTLGFVSPVKANQPAFGTFFSIDHLRKTLTSRGFKVTAETNDIVKLTNVTTNKWGKIARLNLDATNGNLTITSTNQAIGEPIRQTQSIEFGENETKVRYMNYGGILNWTYTGKNPLRSIFFSLGADGHNEFHLNLTDDFRRSIAQLGTNFLVGPIFDFASVAKESSRFVRAYTNGPYILRTKNENGQTENWDSAPGTAYTPDVQGMPLSYYQAAHWAELYYELLSPSDVDLILADKDKDEKDRQFDPNLLNLVVRMQGRKPPQGDAARLKEMHFKFIRTYAAAPRFADFREQVALANYVFKYYGIKTLVGMQNPNQEDAIRMAQLVQYQEGILGVHFFNEFNLRKDVTFLDIRRILTAFKSANSSTPVMIVVAAGLSSEEIAEIRRLVTDDLIKAVGLNSYGDSGTTTIQKALTLSAQIGVPVNITECILSGESQTDSEWASYASDVWGRLLDQANGPSSIPLVTFYTLYRPSWAPTGPQAIDLPEVINTVTPLNTNWKPLTDAQIQPPAIIPSDEPVVLNILFDGSVSTLRSGTMTAEQWEKLVQNPKGQLIFTADIVNTDSPTNLLGSVFEVRGVGTNGVFGVYATFEQGKPVVYKIEDYNVVDQEVVQLTKMPTAVYAVNGRKVALMLPVSAILETFSQSEYARGMGVAFHSGQELPRLGKINLKKTRITNGRVVVQKAVGVANSFTSYISKDKRIRFLGMAIELALYLTAEYFGWTTIQTISVILLAAHLLLWVISPIFLGARPSAIYLTLHTMLFGSYYLSGLANDPVMFGIVLACHFLGDIFMILLGEDGESSILMPELKRSWEQIPVLQSPATTRKDIGQTLGIATLIIGAATVWAIYPWAIAFIVPFVLPMMLDKIEVEFRSVRWAQFNFINVIPVPYRANPQHWWEKLLRTWETRPTSEESPADIYRRITPYDLHAMEVNDDNIAALLPLINPNEFDGLHFLKALADRQGISPDRVVATFSNPDEYRKLLCELNPYAKKAADEIETYVTFAEEHDYAYYVLREYKKRTGKAPILVNFDSHSDLIRDSHFENDSSVPFVKGLVKASTWVDWALEEGLISGYVHVNVTNHELHTFHADTKKRDKAGVVRNVGNMSRKELVDWLASDEFILTVDADVLSLKMPVGQLTLPIHYSADKFFEGFEPLIDLLDDVLETSGQFPRRVIGAISPAYLDLSKADMTWIQKFTAYVVRMFNVRNPDSDFIRRETIADNTAIEKIELPDRVVPSGYWVQDEHIDKVPTQHRSNPDSWFRKFKSVWNRRAKNLKNPADVYRHISAANLEEFELNDDTLAVLLTQIDLSKMKGLAILKALAIRNGIGDDRVVAAFEDPVLYRNLLCDLNPYAQKAAQSINQYVTVAEGHDYAFYVLREYKKRTGKAPVLINFDSHSDLIVDTIKDLTQGVSNSKNLVGSSNWVDWALSEGLISGYIHYGPGRVGQPYSGFYTTSTRERMPDGKIRHVELDSQEAVVAWMKGKDYALTIDADFFSLYHLDPQHKRAQAFHTKEREMGIAFGSIHQVVSDLGRQPVRVIGAISPPYLNLEQANTKWIEFFEWVLRATFRKGDMKNSWFGKRGGIFVYGVLIPFLEEALRPYIAEKLGLTSVWWFYFWYPVIHASIHLIVDTYDYNFKEARRMWWGHMGWSFLFAGFYFLGDQLLTSHFASQGINDLLATAPAFVFHASTNIARGDADPELAENSWFYKYVWRTNTWTGAKLAISKKSNNFLDTTLLGQLEKSVSDRQPREMMSIFRKRANLQFEDLGNEKSFRDFEEGRSGGITFESLQQAMRQIARKLRENGDMPTFYALAKYIKRGFELTGYETDRTVVGDLLRVRLLSREELLQAIAECLTKKDAPGLVMLLREQLQLHRIQMEGKLRDIAGESMIGLLKRIESQGKTPLLPSLRILNQCFIKLYGVDRRLTADEVQESLEKVFEVELTDPTDLVAVRARMTELAADGPALLKFLHIMCDLNLDYFGRKSGVLRIENRESSMTPAMLVQILPLLEEACRKKMGLSKEEVRAAMIQAFNVTPIVYLPTAQEIYAQAYALAEAKKPGEMVIFLRRQIGYSRKDVGLASQPGPAFEEDKAKITDKRLGEVLINLATGFKKLKREQQLSREQLTALLTKATGQTPFVRRSKEELRIECLTLAEAGKGFELARLLFYQFEMTWDEIRKPYILSGIMNSSIIMTEALLLEVLPMYKARAKENKQLRPDFVEDMLYKGFSLTKTIKLSGKELHAKANELATAGRGIELLAIFRRQTNLFDPIDPNGYLSGPKRYNYVGSYIHVASDRFKGNPDMTPQQAKDYLNRAFRRHEHASNSVVKATAKDLKERLLDMSLTFGEAVALLRSETNLSQFQFEPVKQSAISIIETQGHIPKDQTIHGIIAAFVNYFEIDEPKMTGQPARISKLEISQALLSRAKRAERETPIRSANTPPATTLIKKVNSVPMVGKPATGTPTAINAPVKKELTRAEKVAINGQILSYQNLIYVLGMNWENFRFDMETHPDVLSGNPQKIDAVALRYMRPYIEKIQSGNGDLVFDTAISALKRTPNHRFVIATLLEPVVDKPNSKWIHSMSSWNDRDLEEFFLCLHLFPKEKFQTWVKVYQKIHSNGSDRLSPLLEKINPDYAKPETAAVSVTQKVVKTMAMVAIFLTISTMVQAVSLNTIDGIETGLAWLGFVMIPPKRYLLAKRDRRNLLVRNIPVTGSAYTTINYFIKLHESGTKWLTEQYKLRAWAYTSNGTDGITLTDNKNSENINVRFARGNRYDSITMIVSGESGLRPMADAMLAALASVQLTDYHYVTTYNLLQSESNSGLLHYLNPLIHRSRKYLAILMISLLPIFGMVRASNATVTQKPQPELAAVLNNVNAQQTNLGIDEMFARSHDVTVLEISQLDGVERLVNMAIDGQLARLEEENDLVVYIAPLIPSKKEEARIAKRIEWVLAQRSGDVAKLRGHLSFISHYTQGFTKYDLTAVIAAAYDGKVSNFYWLNKINLNPRKLSGRIAWMKTTQDRWTLLPKGKVDVAGFTISTTDIVSYLINLAAGRAERQDISTQIQKSRLTKEAA